MLIGDFTETPLINHLWNLIPNVESLMIVDKDGDIIHQKMSTKFQGKYDIDRQKYIAKKASVRFSIDDFDKELGGLAITINLFKKDTFMLVRALNQTNLLILMMPIHYDISKTIKAMEGITEWPINL